MRGFLLVFSGILLLAFFPSFCRAESPPSLESEVDAFLNAPTESEADKLLQAVRKDPRATVASVEEILQKGPPYSNQKVGDQFHLPVDVNGEEMSYALYVPKSYDRKKAYPLVLCLHGMGFTGDGYLERWEGRLGEEFILACPTMEDGAWWTAAAETLVLRVLREVTSRYHVDPNRVMLTGMSNGGIGTYLIGMMHADLLAAVSPMASGIPTEIFPFLENFKHTGVYIIHGAKDQIMPVSLSRDIHAYFEKLGYPVIYREHDRVHPMAGGHFFPKEEVPALVAWFSKQRRDPYPKEVISVRDIDHLDRFYWTKINQLSEDVASVLGSIENHQEAERVKKGEFARVSAKIQGNRIDLEARRVRRITLYLHPRLVDLGKPVAVYADGKKLFEGKVDPDLSVLLHEARDRHDPSMLFEAQLAVDLPPASRK